MSRFTLPRSLSLSAQLLLALVGFILGTTGALTLAAYRCPRAAAKLQHEQRDGGTKTGAEAPVSGYNRRG